MRNTKMINKQRLFEDESYLEHLFEEDETPKAVPPKEEVSSEKLSDEDIDILDTELNEPAESVSIEPEKEVASPVIEDQKVEGVSSSSMDITTVLKNISNWRVEFEKSVVLDSFVAGAEIVENDTERDNYQYLSDTQYSSFSKLIDSARDIATLVNDLSYDAEKLLSDIELSRRMMISDKG